MFFYISDLFRTNREIEFAAPFLLLQSSNCWPGFEAKIELLTAAVESCSKATQQHNTDNSDQTARSKEQQR